MSKILPAGQHYGMTFQNWSSELLAVRRLRYGPQTFYGVHGNEQASIVFVEKGHCSKRMGHQDIELTRGAMMFIPPERLQADRFPVETTFLGVELSVPFMRRMDVLSESISRHVEFPRHAAQDLSSRLLFELEAPDSASALVFEGLVLCALAGVCRDSRDHHPAPPSWLLRAKEMIHDCALQSLRLHDIADAAGVHPAQLSREFRRFFGLSPGEYLRRVRVDFATTQLAKTDRSLADIALSSGFADQAHFSRVFQRQRRLSPSKYRQATRTPQRRGCAEIGWPAP